MPCLDASKRAIASRQLNDKTWNRDSTIGVEIKDGLEISRVILVSRCILTGTPFTIAMNRHGKVDEAALHIVDVHGDKND